MQNWLFNEYAHCGVDYSDANQAAHYDDQHQKFRNYELEFQQMLAFLELDETADKSLIDLGCGTGTTALLAAGRFKQVYAVDVSEAMLSQASAKNLQQAQNLSFIQAGFLGYQHADQPVDLVITKAVLHHLPDFWKQVALLRINRMLKPGGLLYIHDVVFQFEPQQYQERIDTWIDTLHRAAGDQIKAEVETHIRDEYSTFGWVLEEMLQRAGFSVERLRCNDGFVAEYACCKTRELVIEQTNPRSRCMHV